MIFQWKHRWQTALVASVLMSLLAWLGHGWASLWSCTWPVPAQLTVGVAAGLTALVFDGMLHGLLMWRASPAYSPLFRAHGVAVCGGMGVPEVLMGGLMAGLAEEPFFRGMLLSALLSSTGQPAVAVAASSFLFAGCHWLGTRFFGFWCWACWEGVLFGVVYVTTGSLLAVIVAHALHDWVGYAMFRWRYRMHELTTEERGLN